MGKAKSRGGKSITFFDGVWRDGDPMIARPTDHGMWLGSAVFDGARALAGKAPDLDRHCQRAIRSCDIMGIRPPVTAAEIERLAWDGIHRFPDDAELYICPLFYPTGGFIVPDAQTTQFVLTVQDAPLPEPRGITACRSPFRRPAQDMAPTEAKAACLYPNVARAVRDASDRGFDTGIALDPDGFVAEFSYANLFMAADGAVHTPAANGTFLNGITRQRVIQLLTDAGVTVHERQIAYDELAAADELFATGNYSKVMPCIRLDDRRLEPGPMYRLARELYFGFTATC